MTFTYTADGSEPTNLEKVRGMIGDTDSSDPLLTDEQISPVITANPVLTRAAAACITKIIAKLARRGVDRRIGQTSISSSQMIENYRKLRETLLADGGDTAPSGGAPQLVPVAGGASHAENERIEGDSDFVRPLIGERQDDFPGNAMTTPTRTDPTDGWEDF